MILAMAAASSDIRFKRGSMEAKGGFEIRQTQFHFTVSTLVERNFPAAIEEIISSNFASNGNARSLFWRCGRPKSRRGFHPDLLFRQGHSGDPREKFAQELHLELSIAAAQGRRKSQTRTDNPPLLSAKQICEKLWPDYWTSLYSKQTGWVDRQELNKLKSYYEDVQSRASLAFARLEDGIKRSLPSGQEFSIEEVRLLVRVFPAGLSTLTLSVQLTDQSGGSLGLDDLVEFARRFDPRRNWLPSNGKGWCFPDLTVIHNGLIQSLRHEIRFAIYQHLEAIRTEDERYSQAIEAGANQEIADLLTHARKEAKSLNEWLRRSANSARYRLARWDLETALKPRKDRSDERIRKARLALEEKRKLQRKDLLRDLGRDARVRPEWMDNYPASVKDKDPAGDARPQVEQPPFCLVYLEALNYDGTFLTEDSVAARKLFDLFSGTKERLIEGRWHIPEIHLATSKKSNKRILKSLSWVDDAMTFCSHRGAGLIADCSNAARVSKTSPTWPAEFNVLYHQSAIDIAERTVARWSALGILHSLADATIQDLSLDPLENASSLKNLASIRRNYARLRASRLLYQIDSGSLQVLAQMLRRFLSIKRLEDHLTEKLRQTESLHELTLHLGALDQIRGERD